MIDYKKKYLKYKNKYLQYKKYNLKGGSSLVLSPIDFYTIQDENINEKYNKHLNVLDSIKDAKSSTMDTNIVEKLVSSFLTTLYEPGTPNLVPNYTDWATSWKEHLNAIFKKIEDDNENDIKEVILARGTGLGHKFDEIFFINECGSGAKKLGLYIEELIQMGTGAQSADEGPGSGDTDYEYPPRGSTLFFDKEFFKLLGFPHIQSYKCTNNSGNYLFEVDDELIGNSGWVEAEGLRQANPEKNKYIIENISFAETDNEKAKTIFKKVRNKELGDTKQVTFAKHFILNNDRNFILGLLQKKMTGLSESTQITKLYNELNNSNSPEEFKKLFTSNFMLLTCDKTVFYRAILMGLPCSYTGTTKHGAPEGEVEVGGEEEVSNKIAKVYYPETDIRKKLLRDINTRAEYALRNNLYYRLLLVSSIKNGSQLGLLVNLKKKKTFIILAGSTEKITLAQNFVNSFTSLIDKYNLEIETNRNALINKIPTQDSNVSEENLQKLYEELSQELEDIKFENLALQPFIVPKIVKGGQKYYILYLPDVSLGNPIIIDEINAIFNNNSEFVQYLFRNNPQPTELGNTSMGDITRGGMVSCGTDEPGDPAQIGGNRLDLKTRRLSGSKEAVRTKIHDMNRKNSSQSRGAQLATRRFHNIHTFIGYTNTPTNSVEHYIYNSLLPDYLFDNIYERIPIEHDLIINITFWFFNNLSQLEIIEADGLVKEDIIRTLEIKTYVDTIFLMYYKKTYNYEEVLTSLLEKERIYIIQ